ncbi:MAG: hypothetical protein ABIJ17_02370 [Patescibacteria group bacterium]
MKVNVYSCEDCFGQEIVGRVNYNDNLDFWNGSNWQNGGTGMHKGITKLKNGKYAIIIGSQWQGSKDYAYIVDEKEALQEILKSGNLKLLEEKRFSALRKNFDEMNNMEEEFE